MSVKTLEWNHNEDDDGEHPQVPEKTWNRAMPDLSLSRRASNQTGLQKGRAPAHRWSQGRGLRASNGSGCACPVSVVLMRPPSPTHGATGGSWVADGQAVGGLTGSGAWALFFGQWSLSMGMPWLSFFHFTGKFVCQ